MQINGSNPMGIFQRKPTQPDTLQRLDTVNYVNKEFLSYLGGIHTPGVEGTTLTEFFLAWPGK
jgi:hypothetical protein